MQKSMLSMRLKELRKFNNYTQDYVAEVLETIYMLASLYNVSVDELLHLSIEFDKNTFYEAPGSSQESDDLSAFLEFFNEPRNQKKYQHHTNLEKELLYYFQKIPDLEKRELIEIAKIKARKKNQ